MKCIRCDTDNNLQERTENQGRCKNCQHPFAFEPRSMGEITFTDPFFLNTITTLSDNNVLFFTPKQFFYLLDKRLKPKIQFWGYVFLCFVALFFLSPVFASEDGIGLGWNAVQFMLLGNFIILVISYSAFLVSRGTLQITIKNHRNLVIISILFGGLSIIVATILFIKNPTTLVFLGFIFFVILGVLATYLGYQRMQKLQYISQNFKITSFQFRQWGNTWVRANGSIEKMLPSPSTENQPTNLNSEITAYSFDRAIVCDSSEIAQFLIANNFHFENNCAVLSITGYPQNIFSTVMEMLHRNPNLKVYAIHDASPQGASLVHQLRTNANWFANSSATIYDLGLLPRQVLKSRSLFIRNSPDSKQQAARLPQSVKQELSPDELEWLEKGNFVELESLMPRRLLQVLTRGIALSQAPDVEDTLIPIESDGGLIFATDSFG